MACELLLLSMCAGKREDAEQIRDAPMVHLTVVEGQLDAYDKGMRREELRCVEAWRGERGSGSR